MSEPTDKNELIRKELANLHSIEEMRKNVEIIIAKSGASRSWIYSEIQKIETVRETIAKTLLDLFVVRSDTYAEQKEDKSYIRIEQPLTVELLKEHLDGKITIGTYNLDKENMVKWICFDIDLALENSKEIARLIYQKCVENERFPLKAVVLEASRYPDPSYHVWVFFGAPIPAYAAKFLGEKILEICRNPKVELFPKQIKLEEEGFGNLVKVPLGLHQKSKKWSCLLNPETFEPLPTESIFEIEGTFVRDRDIEEIKRIVEDEKPSYWFSREGEEKEPYKGDVPPCIQAILKGIEEGTRNDTAIRLVCFYLNFCKVEPQKALTSLREWNIKNKPPLNEAELGIILQSALRGHYNFGCNDLILKQFCNRETCLFIEKEPIEIRLSDLQAKLDAHPVRIKVVVMGESNKKMCGKTVSIECSECGASETIDLSLPKNHDLLIEQITSGRGNFRKLYTIHLCDCEEVKRKVKLSGKLDYRFVYCQDVIDPKVKWEQKTYSSYKLVLIGEPEEEALKKIKIEGIVTSLMSKDITILIYEVEPLEKPIPTSMEGFDEYFRNNKNLIEDNDRTIEPYIRGRPIEKLSATLVLHSPYELIYEGESIRGALNTLQLGETKTGKSDILEWIEKNVGGEEVVGETSGRTGIGYTIDHDNKILEWGALPRCDKEICMIDGLDQLKKEDLIELREAMAKQILKVAKSISGVALCRTRIIAAANPILRIKGFDVPQKRTFDAYAPRPICHAIKDFFEDPTLVTRWDFFVPFIAKDVSAEDVAKARDTPPKIPLGVFRNHVFWAWGLEPKDVIFHDEAVTEIERLFIMLQEYRSDSLPLIHTEYKRVLARVSASYAVLTHNVDESGKVNVAKEHVTKAYELLWGLLEKWGYNMYVANERKEFELEESEWSKLIDLLTGDVRKVFLYIAEKEGMERAVLITKLDKSAPTIDRFLSKLKSEDLIDHMSGRRGGYELTRKGVVTYQRMNELLKGKPEIQIPRERPLEERIIRTIMIDKPEEGKCPYCGNEAVLCWQIEEFGGEVREACSDCGHAILDRFRGVKE